MFVYLKCALRVARCVTENIRIADRNKQMQRLQNGWKYTYKWNMFVWILLGLYAKYEANVR